MKLIKIYLSYFIFITISLLFTSCEFSVTTAKIDNVKMCKSMSGEACDKNVKLFAPEDEFIFVSCNLENAPSNTIVKFVWKYVEMAQPIIIDTVTVNSGDNMTNLKLSSNLSRPLKGWPIGKYQVEIIIEDSQRDPKITMFEIR